MAAAIPELVLDVNQSLSTPTQIVVRRDDVSLVGHDSGPRHGPTVVLLHGLAGHAGEWRATVASLSASCRVVAFDQRGHGASTRSPADMSRAAFVADAVAVIEQLGLAPAILVGQSLGAHTAFLTAAARPDIVRGLVVAEASPERDPLARDRLAVLLRAWPVPFASRASALEFFGGDSPIASVWLDGLEVHGGAWWPRFECQTVLDSLCELTERSYWDEWEALDVPTLLVRGEHGWLDANVARRMLQCCSAASLVEIGGAGHDVHIEQPDAWRNYVEPFVAASDTRMAA